ncbi:Sulfide:quinone oxidoreductase, mitochondrial [Grifola frondosa]|uniref:Sulfide:quinone oxidoreductase, mitochondrial n=1 Tax=Grifola frondosa TaxID=5627 RepID=A0A1C7MFM0_GRIFR|nr:Sulfide:quinone oxidoreductase, mitochondrial [Grifola frondosa]
MAAQVACNHMSAMLATRTLIRRSVPSSAARWASTAASRDKFKVLVIGAGSGGLSVANQIYYRFEAAGKPLNEGDIGILDAAEYHYYQPGWTLVGAGLKQKTDTRRPLASLIPSHLAHIPENVKSFSPTSSSVTTTSGRTIAYESLVVATGLQTNWSAIPGLQKALADPSSGVSSIYSYDTCDKVWHDIDALRSGKAIFTQPAGVLKCAGAPQKIMWMAWDQFRKTGRGDTISVDFYTGMPSMFSVKKYSDALNQLRIERGVSAEFQHNLVSVDSANAKATFKKADSTTVDVDYTLLHVSPPMGPLEAMKGAPIADAAGWIPVDKYTLRHTNPEFGNVWALGDCSNLPTSKTAAAVTAQAPVLTENLFSVVDTGKISEAKYDGYTSCPLLTGYGQLMLAEFKYDGVPKETFSRFFGDQTTPRLAFYHLKKDFFPWIYWQSMVKGTWFGASGPIRPKFH